MCGRFSQTKSKQEIKKRFNVKKVPDGIDNLFNIAPEQNIPAILNESPDEVSLARWGLIPSWAKEEKTQYSMINARAETLLEKPAYKRLVQRKRCLIIADSFYEWKKVNGKKFPYRIMLRDDDLFAFAGLWDLWEKEGKSIISCSIITTSPNKLCEKIHDRMPVILSPKFEKDWLSDIPIEKILGMLKSFESDAMKCYEISTKVNNPSNNSVEVISSIK
jgi:putative SOS response-associated peptidase YedK